MEDTCKDCKNREEEIFWTHFQSIHFTQFLRADFLQRLEIPEKFAKNMKKKLPGTVTLKGPSGVVWDVGLKADDDGTLFFDGRWKTFVKDHSLVEDDFLIFKYNGVSHFDVLMFDGKSSCEKASCYFVKKCMHAESNCGHQTRRKVGANPDEIVHNSSQCGLESSPEKSINDEIGAGPSRKSIRNSDSYTESIPVAKRRLRGKELPAFTEQVKVERLETGSSTSNNTTVDGDVFGSLWQATGKRVATQAEKMNALLKAREALTNEGFMTVMKPSHVDRRFYMAIPTAWLAKCLWKENKDVILRMNDLTWKTRFYYHRSRDCGGLSGAWRDFVSDNNLEEHDVCVFEPVKIGSEPIMLDVIIFHVLQAPVPLSQANPSSPPDIVEASSVGACK